MFSTSSMSGLPAAESSGRRYRVALVSHTNSLYGAGRSLLELVLSLRSYGLDVAVVLPAGGQLEIRLKRLRCAVWTMRLPSWIRETDSLGPVPSARDFDNAAAELRHILSQWGVNLVWSNSTITPVGALAAERLGIPHVWHLRELNGAQYGFDFVPNVEEALSLFRAASRRVAVSRTVQVYYENLGCGACDWVYNGIASEASLMSRRRRERKPGPTRLLVVGRILPLKGQHHAIEAINHLRLAGYPVVLRVVGDGDIEACRWLAKSLGIGDFVEFTGFSKEPGRHYRWADIALSCCRIEAMGRSTAEAMSWGLPIAGHVAAGTGELVGNAESGLLYDGDGEQLAKIVAALVDNQRAAAAKGEAGRLWAQRHVSHERHSMAIARILSSLIGPELNPLGIRSRSHIFPDMPRSSSREGSLGCA